MQSNYGQLNTWSTLESAPIWTNCLEAACYNIMPPEHATYVVMILRLIVDTDYGTFRRNEDFSDSVSVYCVPESHYTTTVSYSIKLPPTPDTSPM